MSKDAEEQYRESADQMASLVGKMISYLELASIETLGGRWRLLAEDALRRFNAAKIARQQGNLFDEGS